VTDRLRLGVVGAGGIARTEHLPRLRRIPGVEIVGVANSTPDSSLAVAAAEGIPRAYASWRELLDDAAIDAVLVATRPNLHAPVTIGALEAGKHVLTEARMAATLEQAKAMLAASRARPDRIALLVPASFSAWADRTIARLVQERAVGTLRHVRVLWDASASVAPSEWWRWQRAWSGVNVMALGILFESMARWLGPVTAVQATSRIIEPRKPGPQGPIEADIPDHLLVHAEFGPVSASVEMSTVSVRTGIEIQVIGDEGSIEVDQASTTLVIHPRDGDPRPAAIEPADRLDWTAEIDFVSAVRGGPVGSLTDLATGVRYMAAVDAVDRAARTGQRFAVEEP
jgi:predicted dehydrogenase